MARELSDEDAQMFFLGITTIEAQNTLVSLKVADWPHTKKPDRDAWHRELHRQAYPHLYKADPSKPALSTRELFAVLKGMNE